MDQGMADFVGIDPETSRLVLFDNAADLDDDEISIPMKILRKFPCVDIHKDLLDAHLYIFAHWVLDLLAEKKWISTVKGELVPYLVKKQFRKPKLVEPDSAGITPTLATSEGGPVDGLPAGPPVDPFADLIIKEAGSLGVVPAPEVLCVAHTITPDEKLLCVRANTVHLYSETNRQLPTYLRKLTSTTKVYDDVPYELVHESSKGPIEEARATVGGDAMVGPQSTVGHKCLIKRSIIGKHCTLGAKVSITNSVIMDHVIIEDECKIQNSVVCTNAHVSVNCSLNNVRVGESVTVPAKTKEKNTDLLAEGDYA